MKINLFIEAKGNRTPEYNFVNTLLLKCLTKEEYSNVKIIPVGGKDNLKNSVNKFKENTLENGRNIIIFDADRADNKGGFLNRQSELLQLKATLDIDFDLFLFPNNRDDGEFENLLQYMIVEEHKPIMKCYDKFEGCMRSHKDQDGKEKYILPKIKSRYFTYIYSMKLSKQKRDDISSNWLFDNSEYWNLEVEQLNPLKDFINETCRNKE
ncbi:MAG: DUF3226 domain-containing protein [bacterium]